MFRRSLLLALMAAMAWMYHAEPVRADPSECADYISGGSSDPAFGWLLGQVKVTKTSTVSGSGSLSKFGGSYVGSTEIEYYQGTYAMEGGGTKTVNCGTYTLI